MRSTSEAALIASVVNMLVASFAPTHASRMMANPRAGHIQAACCTGTTCDQRTSGRKASD